jgi:hypothetical protein
LASSRRLISFAGSIIYPDLVRSEPVHKVLASVLYSPAHKNLRFVAP